MKRFIFISFILLLNLILAGCNSLNLNDDLSIEMIAFNSLTDEEKDLIPASPKDSIVEKTVVNESIKPFIDDNYTKGEVYSVTFNHTETDSSTELRVFVDLDKKTVVGKGFK